MCLLLLLLLLLMLPLLRRWLLLLLLLLLMCGTLPALGASSSAACWRTRRLLSSISSATCCCCCGWCSLAVILVIVRLGEASHMPLPAGRRLCSGRCGPQLLRLLQVVLLRLAALGCRRHHGALCCALGACHRLLRALCRQPPVAASIRCVHTVRAAAAAAATSSAAHWRRRQRKDAARALLQRRRVLHTLRGGVPHKAGRQPARLQPARHWGAVAARCTSGPAAAQQAAAVRKQAVVRVEPARQRILPPAAVAAAARIIRVDARRRARADLCLFQHGQQRLQV
jgi:hypothetical protein